MTEKSENAGDALKADEQSGTHAAEEAGSGTAEVTGPDTDGGTGSDDSRASLAMEELVQVRRPVEMYVGAVFLTFAALTPIFVGTMLALQIGAIGENLRQRIADTGTTIDVNTILLLFRFAGGLLLLSGLLFVVFAWTALKPKRWARTAAAALAVIEILLLVGAMLVTTVDPPSLGLVLLAGAGVVLFYLPRSEEFLLTSR